MDSADASERDAKAILRYAEERFWWNRHLQSALLDADGDQRLAPWAMPFVKGFMRIVSDCKIAGHPFRFALLSRRSRYRAGTRYNVRGIDVNGDVANEVETEQLVIAADGRSTSLVQLRGSIPLRWQQRANIKYKPTPKLIGDVNAMRAAFQKHFERVAKSYGGGSIVAVNLIDQKGSEAALEKAFAEVSL